MFSGGGFGRVYNSLELRTGDVPVSLFIQSVTNLSEELQDHRLSALYHAIGLGMTCTGYYVFNRVGFRQRVQFRINIFFPFVRHYYSRDAKVGEEPAT